MHEINFCSSFNWSFIGPKLNSPNRAIIKEDLAVNKQDSVKDKLFRINEPFQLINSKERMEEI